MKLLKKICDEKFSKDDSRIKLREASRIVAVDDNGLLPLLFVAKHNYHKLPGGGIENGENKIDTLNREVMEETGCKIKVLGEVGQIIEYRSAINFNWVWNLKQTSYCYWGKIISKCDDLNLTKEEISEDFKLVWFSVDEAITIIKNDKANNFEGSFIQQRELMFLETARQIYPR